MSGEVPDLLVRSCTAVTVSFLLPYSHAGIFLCLTSLVIIWSVGSPQLLLSFPDLAFLACWRAWLEPEAVPAASCQKGKAAVKGLHRIIESLGLEKTSKIMKSNHPSNTTIPTKPYPEVPHLHIF